MVTAALPQTSTYRLTQFGHGGGCACKIPPGELEQVLAGLTGATGGLTGPTGHAGHAGHTGSAGVVAPEPAADGATGGTASEGELLVGLSGGDDAAVVGIRDGLAVVATTDFFTPVVDDAYDWGRIAAANALSDVYAMGGWPLVALNLLCWPREVLPFELAAEVLRGGLAVATQAGCHVAGGHSVDDPEPKYGMAVTGLADPAAIIRNDAGRPGLPLSLTKPLGLGVLNCRHKATGEVFPQAVDTMTTLNREAAAAALAAGVRCGTDVTGFGLLGHLHKLALASGVTAVLDAAAVPFLDGAREAARDGYISGGTRRNLSWVAPHLDLGPCDELAALLLADAQTSGGLLLAGEIPGAPVIGHLTPRTTPHTIIIR